MMMTIMKTMMTTTITRMVTATTMSLFFRQQPTLVGCIPGRGGVGDFYDDDDKEDDNDGDDDEGDHCQ